MNESAPVQESEYVPLHRDLSSDETLFHVPLRAADARRSAKNISLWNSYLPTACVRTMVRMGWDYTT
jgi:hypothetical protein